MMRAVAGAKIIFYVQLNVYYIGFCLPLINITRPPPDAKINKYEAAIPMKK